MNGLEALQAMKEGKIVIKHRRNTKAEDKDPYERYYCYRAKNIDSTEEGCKVIWTRRWNEWTWHESNNPVEFWLQAEGFEIAEDEA